MLRSRDSLADNWETGLTGCKKKPQWPPLMQPNITGAHRCFPDDDWEPGFETQ